VIDRRLAEVRDGTVEPVDVNTVTTRLKDFFEAKRRARVDEIVSRLGAERTVTALALRDLILRHARAIVLQDDREMLVAALALALESARQP
jgi:hypothetical protein